jgi:hypothetical protein
MAFSGETWGKVKKYTKEQIAMYLTSGSTPKGSWDASTNTPTLTDGTGRLGEYYDVVVAGKWNNIDFLVGDRVIYNSNSKWSRVPTGVEREESDEPIIVGYVSQTTTALPTTRASGKALKVGDYVKVLSTATLPFTINGITFDSYSDEAEWNGTAWQIIDYSLGKTNEVGVFDKTKESLGGLVSYQSDINTENVEQIKKLYEVAEYDKVNRKIKLTKVNDSNEELLLENLATTIEINCTSATEHKYDFILKDVSGTEISKVELDLPLELIKLVDFSYDNDNEKFILKWKDAQSEEHTIEVPASGILNGVVTQTATQTLTNKTINADDNTIKELTGANLKNQATTDKKKTWVVQDDGSWALGKAGSDTDNETIEEANEKLQLKDNGIKFAKLNEDLVVESVRDKDTATDTTLASEKAIRTELDKAGDKLEVNKATDEDKINVKLYDKVRNELSSVDIVLDDTLKYSDKLYSMPIKEVETLPTENIDQKYLYKLKTENTIYWYDKTEWIALTAKTGMITVEAFPTTDIQEGLLYKLTKNVEHTSTDKVYSMVNKEYEFSEETKEGAYTYNSTTNKWYYGTTEITVEVVENLPTATSDNEGKYYDHNSALYLSTGAYKVIVDYYRGVYAYFNGDWQALYSTDVTVNYDNIREESLPTLNGVKIKGDHSSNDYSIYSKSLANATFQTKEITKIENMDATTVQTALEELRLLLSVVFKLKGNKDYYADLPTEDNNTGDVWIVRYTKEYSWNTETYTDVETLTNEGIEHLTTTDKWYNDGVEIEVISVISLPSAKEDLKDKYYFVSSTGTLSKCKENDNYTESFTQYWYNEDGDKWSILGKSIDTEGFEKVSDGTDQLKTANPTCDMDGSALKYNSTNIYCKVVATLNTPVTDIQSADRELITIPKVVKIPDQSINLKVKTHEGQFTANENITELPTTWRKTDYVKTFKDNAVQTYYTQEELDYASGTDASKTSTGYYYATDTKKLYNNGSEVSFNSVDLPPTAESSLVGKYYGVYGIAQTIKAYTESTTTTTGITHNTTTDKWYNGSTEITVTNCGGSLPESTVANKYKWFVDQNKNLYYFDNDTNTYMDFTLCKETKGVIQDWNANTGALIYDYDGATPRMLNNQDEKQITGGSSLDIYKLKNDAEYGVKIVGYETKSYTNMKGESASVDVPIYEVEKVTVTADEEYIKMCAYANSGLNVNASGTYGHYTIKESDDSKKYSIHSEQYGLVNGFNGEVTFTPDNNSGDWQTIDNAYIKDNKLYVRGDITIDAIRFSETM